MADIEFGDTHGEQLATVVRVVRDLHRDIYGNGSPGLKKKAEEFMNIAEGVERERARQHKQNSFKLNLKIAICALLTVIIGGCSIIVTVEVSDHKITNPAKIFGPKGDDPVLLSATSDTLIA